MYYVHFKWETKNFIISSMFIFTDNSYNIHMNQEHTFAYHVPQTDTRISVVVHW